jgi:hypothetical protein
VAVSKIATMFATLVPPPSAADAPQPVLLRHNDLNYLANHLLLLPFLHSPELERLAGGEVWFGDEALRLRAQARALANESVRGRGGGVVGSGRAEAPRRGGRRAAGGLAACACFSYTLRPPPLTASHPPSPPRPPPRPPQLSVQQAALSEPLSQLLPLAVAAEAVSAGRGRAAAAGAGDGPERAIKQLLYTLERAGRLVWPTLPPGEALDFSARLLGPLFKALSDDVLGMDDIGEGECDGIVALCRPLVAGAPAALLAAVDGTGQQQGLEAGSLDIKALVGGLWGGAGEGRFDLPAGRPVSAGTSWGWGQPCCSPHPRTPRPAHPAGPPAPSPPPHPRPQLEDALQQRAWGLRKLGAILAILEAKLTDIVARWESGELQRAGLSRREVEALVEAVFENTDHRAQCLQRIDAADA